MFEYSKEEDRAVTVLNDKKRINRVKNVYKSKATA